MDGVVVRGIVPEDFEGVRLVDELTQREYMGKIWDGLNDKEKERSLKSRKGEFGVNCETGFSFVAEMNSDIVGFLFAHKNLPFIDEIIVRHIAVHPGFQGRGVGKKLFCALINKAREECQRAIKSLINPDNAPSIRLHKRVGFKVVDWKRATLSL